MYACHTCIRTYIQTYIHTFKEDYKLAETVGQKPSIAILLLNLVGHPIHCIIEMVGHLVKVT